MRTIIFATLIVFGFFPHPVIAQGEVAALVAICDQAAASPLDGKRPAGVRGVPADKVEPKIAIAACEAAVRAAPDDPRMIFQLGRAYGAAKAYESARAQYAKADEFGYPLATNNLAALYLHGEGVLADPLRAVALFEKAANAGLAFAMKNLGGIYLDGKSLPKNLPLAKRWYERAANAGDSEAMYAMGQLYRNGVQVVQNERIAREWYTKSAEAGNAEAMGMLGYYNEAGKGGPKDIVAAKSWYRKAIEAGSTNKIVADNLRKLDRSDRPSRSPRRGGAHRNGGGSSDAGNGASAPGWKLQPAPACPPGMRINSQIGYC